MQENIRILFPKETTSKLTDILKRYNLIESDELVLKTMQERKYSKETLLVITIRDFVMGKTSNHQFLDTLHKELGTSKEVTKNLAIDIVDNLVPLLEKIPENQL